MKLEKAKGFTLIELIIVIVILGILSVVAAPKFINLSSDANKAVLEGMAGTASGAVNLVYAKAIIQGVVNDAEGNVDLDGDGVDDISTVYGFPSANRTTGIANALQLNDEWAYGDTFGGGQFFVSPSRIVGFSGITNNNIPLRSPNCYLTYIPPAGANELPTYDFVTSGC
ncbi:MULTISPECIES: prepilin-type N-terminal cleavage/methylation domain-containing protein [Alteromonadaceae]|uniref:prepilin-type N-terminal cleavage/methylation domain-containing protein n=1 Tax=Alteromonadaceae TaxID=72275 RepID=UPI001C08C262|nr:MULTISPECIES: prepilin-type N-terminal cleavage/methylation domain-containing protein [unclassified Aliiglaciecola]MBU2876075.1 prepilin-type N-terminal cleavage/methylation domain-containing protein [Aliiglaciecola lipolytica]MDO6713159.1 prepilin-type N-terminal cleavage/methylation domain-containing protein [Aliiglaciecola sp. 2_MG-2023]MDO6754167.1 prepilin-type N-terminal cleavage/methylation domain-containing protein [Aliiglaciecola sp. 1_MG-2023]